MTSVILRTLCRPPPLLLHIHFLGQLIPPLVNFHLYAGSSYNLGWESRSLHCTDYLTTYCTSLFRCLTLTSNSKTDLITSVLPTTPLAICSPPVANLQDLVPALPEYPRQKSGMILGLPLSLPRSPTPKSRLLNLGTVDISRLDNSLLRRAVLCIEYQQPWPRPSKCQQSALTPQLLQQKVSQGIARSPWGTTARSSEPLLSIPQQVLPDLPPKYP